MPDSSMLLAMSCFRPRLPACHEIRSQNITQIVTLDEDHLSERVARIAPSLMAHVDAGLKLVLDLYVRASGPGFETQPTTATRADAIPCRPAMLRAYSLRI